MLEGRSYLESSRQRIKVHKALIDEAGRRQISTLLAKSQDPYQTISEIQSSRSLNFPRASPALSFLDVLQCSRSSVYQNLLENLKRRLESQLDAMTDESKLIIMLKETISFMPIRDLKQVPISIIKRLSTVPDLVLNLLAKNGFLMDVPLNVRRKAWEICLPLFCETADAHCRAFLLLPASADSSHRRSDDPINQLCECIGKTEKLFSAFADYCAGKVREESAPSWGRIIRNVLNTLQEKNEKIGSLGKLHDLSWVLGHCIRQGKIETKHIVSIVETLKFFMVTQHTRLESAYEVEYANAVRARAAYASTKSIKVINTSSNNNSNNNSSNNISSSTSSKIKINDSHSKSYSSASIAVTKPLAPPSPVSAVEKRPREDPPPARKPIPPAASADDILKSLLAVFKEAYRFLTSTDKDGVFTAPVSDSIAPGYSRMIRHPMDLTKIKNKINAKSYGNMEDLSADVKLMFKNCVSYNNPTSFYGKLALSYLKKWEAKEGDYASKLAAIISDPTPTASGIRPGVRVPEVVKAEPLAAAALSIPVKAREREVKIIKKLVIMESDSENEEFEAPLKKQKINTYKAPVNRPTTQIQSAPKLPPPAPTPALAPGTDPESDAIPIILMLDKSMNDKEAFRATLDAAWQYLSDVDSDSIFATPVTDAMAPGYSTEIREPMNLSLIHLKICRKKYRNMDAFDRDVQLMFSNCILYDRNLSYYSKISKKLSKQWTATKKILEKAMAARRSLGVESSNQDLAAIAEKVSTERSYKKAATMEDPTSSSLQESDVKVRVKIEEFKLKEEEVIEKASEKIKNEPVVAEERKEETVKKAIIKEEKLEVVGDTEVLGPRGIEDKPTEKVSVAEEGAVGEGEGVNKVPVTEGKERTVAMQVVPTSATVSPIAPPPSAPSSTASTNEATINIASTTKEMDVSIEECSSASVTALPVLSVGEPGTLPVVSDITVIAPTSSSSSRNSSSSSLTEGTGGDSEGGRQGGEAMDVVGAEPIAESLPAQTSTPVPVLPDPNLTVSTQKVTQLRVVSKPLPPVPIGPPELPHPSAILLSSRKADSYFKRQAAVHDGAGIKAVGEELPGVLADGRLLWVLCILRDPTIQNLILRFLTGRLSEMLKSKNSLLIPSRGGHGVQVGLLGAVMGKKTILPNEDVICKFAIQLCQLSLSNEHAFLALDQSLLRAEIPMIMFDVLCGSSDLSGIESSSTISASQDVVEDSLENFVSQSSKFRQHSDIAKHAVDTSAKSKVMESDDSEASAQLRLSFLESLTRQLLDLNPIISK